MQGNTNEVKWVKYNALTPELENTGKDIIIKYT